MKNIKFAVNAKIHYMKLKLSFFFLFLVILLSAQNSWEVLNPKPSSGSYRSLVFSNNRGFAINDSQQLIITADYGQSWSVKQQVSSANDIKFFGNYGYIVGDSGYVLKSVDSGETWSVINVGASENLNSVDVFSNKIIISSGTNLYVSTDGVSWNKIPFNIPNVWAVKTVFTSSSKGVVYTKGSIFRTADGGNTWNLTYGDNQKANDLNLLYFKNENEGYLHDYHRNFLKTVDGGQTWSAVVANIPYRVKSAFFINESTGFLVGQYGNIYKTTDNGASWVNYPESYFIDSGKDLNSVYFTSSTQGFAVGNNGIILKTDNNGDTWEKYTFTYDSVYKIQKNNNFTVINAGTSFFKTNDYASWQKLGSPVEEGLYPYIMDFQFVSDLVGYALVGTSGSTNLAKTVDGGVSWTIVPDSYSGARKLQFINENVGFRSDSGLTKTTDGGLTWTTLSNAAYYNVKFVSEQVGYAMGNSKLYKSVDGGMIWNIISGAEYINGFDVINENTIYASASNSFMRTNSGGEKWEKVNVPNNYYYVNFSDANIGFLTGGNINDNLYTDNGGITWNSFGKLYDTSVFTAFDQQLYTGSGYGRLARTNITTYNPFHLVARPASLVTAEKAVLAGYASANIGKFDNVVFEVSTDNAFSNIVESVSAPGNILQNQNTFLSATVNNLMPSTKYFFRVRAVHQGTTQYSNVLDFTTLPSFTQVLSFPKIHTNQVTMKADITSNDSNGIQNIQFIYGTDQTSLNNVINVTPNSVDGNSSQSIPYVLSGLQADTRYYVKIKFNHNGNEFLSNVYTFKTLNGPLLRINPNSGSSFFTGFVSADADVSNIVFQYGTLNFEQTLESVPNFVEAGTSNAIRSIYASNFGLYPVIFYRAKAEHLGNTIYSKILLEIMGIPIDMARKNEVVNSPSSAKVNGYINTDGNSITNLKVVYGTSSASLNNSVTINPGPYTVGDTDEISADLNGLDENTTYYYRYSARYNNQTHYSDIYSFKLAELGTHSTKKEEWTVYPNPFDQIFKINGTVENVVSAALFDSSGKLIRNIDKNKNLADHGFDTGEISSGLYFLHLKLKSGEIVIKKIMKK